MNDSSVKWFAALLLLAAIAATAWWLTRSRPEPTPVIEAPLQPAPEADAPKSPLYPVPPLPSPEAGPLVDLPPLDDSDAYFKLALVDAFGRPIDAFLVESGLIDRFVATIDNLPRKHVAENIRPLKQLGGTFQADAVGGDEHTILPANATRYAAHVALLANADIDSIVAAYRRFYPLLQQSYVRLGYPEAYFNDRVIEVIDHLLDTPRPPEPILLVRPHVLYQFADPQLEALSSGQKLLLRMGGENRARVEAFLIALRTRLTSLD